MNCSQANENMMKYFDGNLNDIEYAQLKQHFKVCTECSRSFEELDSVLGFLERESWAEPPENFEIQVMQRVNSLEVTQKKRADGFLTGLYSLVIFMVAMLAAFVIFRIREMDVVTAVSQLVSFADASSTLIHAASSILGKLSEMAIGMGSVVLQVAGNIASSYYYIFIAILLMLLAIHKALVNMLGENGGSTR